jgi:hypothetical protein
LLWLTGGGMVICLAMIVGLLALVAWQGFSTFWPVAVVYALALVGVPDRRPARGEQRGRRLPGHLRHGRDDAADVAGRRALRRAGRALPARVRQGRAAGQAVRIAVNNLAGVPSIVFGVFGLGFFCYLIGGRSISCSSPPSCRPRPSAPAALMWASLTLALLTLPVVIVATEEALAAVPRLDARGLATPAGRASGRRSGASCCRGRCRGS